MRLCFLILMLALILATGTSLDQPTLAATGDLDRSFGGYGSGGQIVSEPFPGSLIADAVVTPDEQLIVVGSDGRDIVVARYNANGMLDPNFGSGGVTKLDFNGQIDTASALLLSFNANQILVVGTTVQDSPEALSNFAVARLTAAGMLDPTFDQDGKVRLDFNGRADQATAVAEIPIFNADKLEYGILVVGSVEQSLPNGPCVPACTSDLGMIVLKSNGGIDFSFGTAGRSQHDFGGDETPLAVVIANTTIYTAGYRTIGTNSEYFVSAHNYGSGMLLPAFNGTGYRTGATPARLTDLIVVGSTDLVAIGAAGDNFGLLRLTQNGLPAATWGNNGLVSIDFGGEDRPHMLLQLADGRLAVAGVSGTRLALASISTRGQPLPGSVVTSELAASGAVAERALTLALVPDSRLWTIAAATVGGTTRLAQTRHFLAGPVDAGGQLALDFGKPTAQSFERSSDSATAAVFQPDGRLLVAGRTFTDQREPYTAVVRYTTAGALDPTFDGDGRLLLPGVQYKEAVDIAVHDGKIIVAGGSFDAARFNLDGSPDLGFNGSGKVSLNIANSESTRMLVQPDGKIVLVGYTFEPYAFVVARFTNGGAPDLGFGSDGVQRIGGFGLGFINGASDIALQPDGKLVVVGDAIVSTTDLDAVVLRLNPNGSLDPSFDGDGRLTVGFGGFDVLTSVVIQPDGAILAGGTSTSSGVVFVRLLPTDGALDASFGSGGKQQFTFTGNDRVRGLLVSATGITAALCDETVIASATAGAVLRLKFDGSLDERVNGNGRLPFRFGGADCALGLAATSGRIAAVGHTIHPRMSDNALPLPTDFAVAVYHDIVAIPPPPTTHQIYAPLIRR